MKGLFVLILTCLSAASTSAFDHRDRYVTVAQARTLVLTALSSEQKRLPSLGADAYKDPNTSRFLFFTVTWAGAPDGSAVVGNYAVDPRTGDVFSATVGCEEQKNNALQALQKRLRLDLHLSQSEYRRLKTKGPLCED